MNTNLNIKKDIAKQWTIDDNKIYTSIESAMSNIICSYNIN